MSDRTFDICAGIILGLAILGFALQVVAVVGAWVTS